MFIKIASLCAQFFNARDVPDRYESISYSQDCWENETQCVKDFREQVCSRYTP